MNLPPTTQLMSLEKDDTTLPRSNFAFRTVDAGHFHTRLRQIAFVYGTRTTFKTDQPHAQIFATTPPFSPIRSP